ncbi:MAG: sensor histidine kinase [Planctomycetota bacterium]
MEKKSLTERDILMELGFVLREEKTLAGMAERVLASLSKLDKKFVAIDRIIESGQYMEIFRHSGDLRFLGKLNSMLKKFGIPSFRFEGWRWSITEKDNVYTRMYRERKALASDNIEFPDGDPADVIRVSMDQLTRDFIPRQHVSYKVFRFIKPEMLLHTVGYNSVIVVPFYNGETMAGAISTIGSIGGPVLSVDELDLIKSVANIVSVHLTNITSSRALEASEAKWTALVDHATDGIALCRDGWIQLGNQRFKELTGLNPPCAMESFLNLISDDVHGKYSDVLRAEAESTDEIEVGRAPKPVIDPAASMLASGPGFSGEFNATLELGALNRERILRVSYSSFPYEDSSALLLFLHDITQERKLESDLAEQERIASLGVVAAGLSHELNNPLAAILTHIELLRSRSAYGADAEKFFEVINRNVHKMKKILHELSRFAEERLPRPTKASLISILGECLDEMAEYMQEHDVMVVRNFADFEDTVEDDSRLLRQAIANLIVNAVDAMKEPPRKIEIACEPDKGDSRNVYIRIKDCGIGVPPEIRNRIFEPFFTASKDGKGTGLGLTIVRKIIRTHRGNITLKSNPEGGTTFTISLPLRKTASARSQRAK